MEAERSDWQSSLEKSAPRINEKEQPLELKKGYLQVLPSIRPYPRTVYIMRIPAPYRIQTFRLQVKGSFQSWGIM